jgi:Ca-activated chloride channel family protein
LTLKLRYKEPLGSESKLIVKPVRDVSGAPSASFRFAAGVAAFGMLLRDSKHKGNANFQMVRELVSVAPEPGGDELARGLLDLVRRTERLRQGSAALAR